MSTTKHTLCDTCTPGVINDDWTHLDGLYLQEDANNMMDRITSVLELLGWLTYVGDANQPGYFDCDLCWETQCGGGSTFTGEKT